MKHRFAIVDVDRAKPRYVGMMAERRHLFLAATSDHVDRKTW
ncbi:hypothetical protein P9853_10045 [Geobacillus stearothermophilus]|nr:hypothetical protein [Geobacillus stearothermophilus]